MWRAVLFDLDGVLVDSYEAWFLTMNAIAQDLSYPAISREAFAQGWGQGVEEDVRRFYWNHSVPDIERCLEESYPRHLDHLTFDPRAAAVVDALRDRRVPMALVTNTPGPLAHAILQRGGLQLDAVVGGTDVPRPKPEPDIPLRACELLGVAPGEALVVGDTAFDRDSAHAAGIAFAGLRFDCERRLEHLDEVVVLVSGP
jgi:phosphoglycolate phosphatase